MRIRITVQPTEANMTRQVMHRRRFTIAEKLRILRVQIAEALSDKATFRRFGIQGSQLVRWRSNMEKFTLISKTNKSVGEGRKSLYHEAESAIRDFILEIREQRGVVSVRSVIFKLHELCPEARDKSFRSKQQWVYRYLRRESF